MRNMSKTVSDVGPSSSTESCGVDAIDQAFSILSPFLPDDLLLTLAEQSRRT